MNNLTNYERLLLVDLKGPPQLAKMAMWKAQTLLFWGRITEESFTILYNVYQKKNKEEKK